MEVYLPKTNKFLTIQEAATALGVSTKTLRRWEAKGLLSATRTGGNQRRYSLDQLSSFIPPQKTIYDVALEKKDSPRKENTINVYQKVQDIDNDHHTVSQVNTQVKELSFSNTAGVIPLNEEVVKNHRSKFVNLQKPALLIMFGIVFFLSGLFISVRTGALQGTQNLLASDRANNNMSYVPKFLSFLIPETKPNKALTSSSYGNFYDTNKVLGTQTLDEGLVFQVNIPTNLGKGLRVSGNESVAGNITTHNLSLSGSIITNNNNINAGTGSLTASNVIYSVSSGTGIAVSGGQTSVISNTGLLSLNGQTGVANLTAGSNIAINGLTISASLPTTDAFKTIAVSGQTDIAAAGEDKLTFVAGTGTSITTDATNKKLTISSTVSGLSQWTTTGNDIYYNLGKVGIGTITPGSTLDVFGNATISGTLGLGGNLRLSSLGTGVLHSSSTGIVSSSSVNLQTDVSSFLATTSGGTGITSYSMGDLLYASAANTLSTRSIGSAGQVLTVVGGLPTWSAASAAACLDCVITDPSSTQIIVPTAATATGLSVGQSVGGTVDVFNVKDNVGNVKYLAINNAGNIAIAKNATVSGTFANSVLNTNNGLVYTNASGVFSQSAAGTNGQLLLGQTGAAPSFQTLSGDATITNAGVVTLKNTGTAGTYGGSSQSAVFTTDAQGRVTTVTNTSIQIDASQIISGQLGVGNGGTGLSSLASGSLLYGGGGSSNLHALGIGGNNTCLLSNSNVPTWGTCALGTNYWQLSGSTLSPLTQTQGLAIGTTSALAALDVRSLSGTQPTASISGATTNASLIVDNSGSGNLFTASSSGLTRFVIGQNGALTIGTAGNSNGTIVLNNSVNTNTTTLKSGAPGSSLTLTLPTTAGSVNNCLITDGNGNLSFTACTGGAAGGVSSVDSLTGALTLANSSGVSSTITINDASTLQKGIAQFNSSNFSASSGIINTIQDITTSSSPTFATLNLTNASNQIVLGSGNKGTLSLVSLGQAVTYTLPDPGGATAAICLSSGNCIGGGSGAVGGSGTQNYIAKFTDGSHIANSLVYDNGLALAIGTTTPLATLDIRAISGTTAVASFSGKTSSAGLIVDNSGSGDLFTASTSGFSRFVITQGGNVGIGTSIPSTPLEVNGTIRTDNGASYNTLATNGSNQFTISGNAGQLLQLTATDNVLSQWVAGGGSVRLKTNTAGAGNSNRQGLNLTIASGESTGNGVGSNVIFQTGPSGSSGTQENALVERMRIDATGNVGIGTTTPNEKLDINGNLSVTGVATSSALAVGYKINQVTAGSGNAFFSGSVGIGNTTAANGTLDVTGTINASTGFKVAGTSGLATGTGVNCINVSGGIVTGTGSCGGNGTNYWIQTSGIGVTNGGYTALGNLTTDLLVGGLATSSAKFAVLNVNSGTPVASVSAQTGGANSKALVLGGDGSLQTVNNNTLTVGGATTGDIQFKPGNSGSSLYLASNGNVGVGTSNPGAAFELAQNGIVSTPGEKISGSWFTGGTPSTTKPQLLVEPSGTSSTNWNTNGTGVGINAASGFTGNLLDLQVASTQKFYVAYSGYTQVNNDLYVANRIFDGQTPGANSAALLLGWGNSNNYSANGTYIGVAAAPSFTGNLIDLEVGGVSKFEIQGNGNVGIGTTTPNEKLDINGNLSVTGVATSSALAVGYKINQVTAGSGNAFFSGSVGIGNTTAANGTLDVTGTINASTGFKVAGTSGLATGTGVNCINVSGGIVTGTGSCGGNGTNYWIQTSGIGVTNGGYTALGNLTTDLLVGGLATSSAKFAVLNVNSGTPVASVSAQTGGANSKALVLGGDGSLQTVNNNTLTIGGNTTGDIILSPGNGNGNVNINGSVAVTGTKNVFSASPATSSQYGLINFGSSPFDGVSSGFFNGSGNGTFLAGNTSAASAYKAAVLANSPAIYYRLNETSGTTVVDSSINGRNGTYGTVTLNQAGATTGDADKAIQDSGNAAVTNSGTGLPTGAGNRSDEIWFKASSCNTNTIIGYGGAAANGKWNIRLNSTNQVGWDMFTSSPTINTSISMCDGNWHYFVDTYDGTTIKLYIDKQFQGSVSQTTNTQSSSLYIGANVGDGNDFTGYLDEFAIYNSVLQQSDITAHYNAASSAGSYSGNFADFQVNGISEYKVTGAGSLSIAGLLTSTGTGVNSFSGQLGIGTSIPLATLDVRGQSNLTPVASFSANSSFAALVTDNKGVGDLFTASASGQSRFTIQNNGNIQAGGTLTGLTGLATSGTVTFSALNSNNNSILYTNGLGNVLAATTTGSNLCLLSNGSNAAPSWGNCSGAVGSSSYWQINSSVLSPGNTTNDLAIGGSATSSAAFQVFAISKGSVPAGTVAAAGNLQVGGVATSSALAVGYGVNQVTAGSGNAIISGNVGIGTTNVGSYGLNIAGSENLSTGNAYLINGASVLNATALGSSVTASSLTSVGTLGSLTVSGLISANGGASVASGQTLTLAGLTSNNNSVLYTNASGNVLAAITTSNAQCLLSNGSGAAPTWGNCSSGVASSSYWQLNGSTLSPGILTNGVAVGTTTGLAALDIHGLNATQPVASISGNTNFAAVVIDNTTGDLLTASASGATRFTINNNGNLIASGKLTGLTGLTTSGNLALSSINTNNNSILYTDGSGVVGAATTVGTNLCLLSNGAGAGPSWQNCANGVSSSNYWQLNGSTLSPGSLTNHLGVGTINALAALDIHGLNATQPVASISGATTNAGLLVDNSGSGDIFTASSSGLTRFTIAQNGDALLPSSNFGVGANPTLTTGTRFEQITGNGTGVSGYGSLSLVNPYTGINTVAGALEYYGGTKKIGAIRAASPTSGASSGKIIFSTAVSSALSDYLTLDATGNTSPYTLTLGQQNGTVNGSLGVYNASAGSTVTQLFLANNTTDVGSNAKLSFGSFDLAGVQDELASIIAVKTARATGNVTSDLTFNVTNAATAATEAMRIASNGNVGIGTTTPGQKLDINGNLSVAGVATTSALAVGYTINQVTAGSGNAIFSGTIGVGVATPLATLDVRGNSGTTPIASVSGTSSFAALVIDNSGTGDSFTASSSGTTRFVINQAGNIGIGTSKPLFGLDLQNSQSATVAAQIYNTNSGTDADGLAVRLGFTGSGTAPTGTSATGNRFIAFLNGNGNLQGAIDSNGNNGIQLKQSGIGDFAEYLKKDSNEAIDYGALVCENVNGNISACTQNNGSILGVTSQHATVLAGNDLGSSSMPVAFVGQVQTKVSTSSGVILPGDAITASMVPGVGIKAITAGQIVGHALQGYSGSGIGEILLVVQPGWYDPGVKIGADGTLSGNNVPDAAFVAGVAPVNQLATISTLSSNLSSQQAQSDKLATDTAQLSNDVKQLQTQSGLLSTAIGVINNSISNITNNFEALNKRVKLLEDLSGVSTQSATINYKDLSKELSGTDLNFSSATVSANLTVLGKTMVSDLGVTGNLSAGLLAINGQDGAINSIGQPLKLQGDGLFAVDIENGKVTIDPLGNIMTKGEVTAKKINIDTTDVAAASAGQAILKAGQVLIDVSTNALTGKSLIFATPDKPVAVAAIKQDSHTLRITIDKPQQADMKVNWWIVN